MIINKRSIIREEQQAISKKPLKADNMENINDNEF